MSIYGFRISSVICALPLVVILLHIICTARCQELDTSAQFDQEELKEESNRSPHELVHRIKRFLTFENGATVKNVLGILIPVQFGDNSNRSLNLGYNFQSQYTIPSNHMHILKAPFFTGFARSDRDLRQANAETDEGDDSRLFLYETLERTWARRGRHNGRDCILRSICEVASSPHSRDNGMLGELVDTIFTPHSGDQHFGEGTPFHDARLAGLNHADCQQTYKRCSPGDGFLDSISHFFEH